MNPRPGLGHRAATAFTRLLVTLLVLGLGGAVAFLLSQLNARTFSFAQENGQLVVMKGRMLPMGALPYQPGDARQADAYAPLTVEGQDVSGLVERRFSERDELDRALFSLLESLARYKVLSDKPAELERGLYYLRRAELLSGLTDEQRRSLASMKADVAFFQAKQKLEEARRGVSEAMVQLKLAAESRNRNTPLANQFLTTVGPAAQALEQALRAAEASLGNTPAEQPPRETPPAATPTAAPETQPTPDASTPPNAP
ncbi:IF-2 protein [Archangium primigenium]|nr:IF-2 protein [Archangium primigenium]